VSDEEDTHSNSTLIEKINELRNRLSLIDEKQKEYGTAETSTRKEIANLQIDSADRARNLRHTKDSIVEIQQKLTAKQAENSGDPTQRDKWLERQEDQIRELDRQIENLYGKSKQAREELEQLNRKQLSMLDRVNEELTPLFSHFASKFLGTECNLVVSTITRQRKPITFMYPRFNDKDRELSTSVSESQKFFLDQAFRMALIELFTRMTGSPAFYIAETPEGSLDLAYERNVANMYLEFASSQHSIVITSNLNSSNFLQALYTSFSDNTSRENRTLDLLQYGKLSAVQKRERDDFEKRFKQLQLNFNMPE
jgi:uncharacterized membrane protein